MSRQPRGLSSRPRTRFSSTPAVSKTISGPTSTRKTGAADISRVSTPMRRTSPLRWPFETSRSCIAWPAFLAFSSRYREPIFNFEAATSSGAVKGAGEGAIRSLLEARKNMGGTITSIFALVEQIDLRLVNKKVLECLVKAGAFDALSPAGAGSYLSWRPRVLAGLDRILDHGGLELYAGNDDLLAPFLRLGGAGGICVASHIAGRRMREMVTAARAGDLDRTDAIDRELQPLYDVLSITTNPIPLKAALNLLGHDVGGLRLPLVEADAAQTATLQAALELAGILPVAAG